MSSRLSVAAASLLLACAFAPAARADDLAALRAEIESMKNDYAARVQQLEARITELEANAAAASGPAVIPSAPAVAGATPATSDPRSGSSLPAAGPIGDPSMAAPSGGARNAATAFNPAMSVILGGRYTNASQDPEGYAIAGFIPSGGEIGPGERSFNLGESELTLSASIDPYFSGWFTAAVTPENEIEVEEAYFRTSSLPAGFTMKGGRFFSALGYTNEVHAHAWDFADQPLVYQAFFGGQLAHDGVQVKWVAPTDLFVELGAESGNGQEFPGSRRGVNGLNGATLFGHVGHDIGVSASWRAGVSYVDLRADERAWEDSDAAGLPVVNAFSGTSRTWVGDFVFKWAPQGNSAQRNLELQGEYLRRTEEGDLTFDLDGVALSDGYRSRQSGWYLQGVYQFMPRWRAGVRYDSLDSGDLRIGLVDAGTLPAEALPALLSASPSRATVMFDWSPSEFSRLRAQYAWDDARDSERDRQWQLQYLYSLGAHGAHKY